MSLHPDQPDYSIPSLGPISKESRREWRSRIDNNGDAATIILARGLYLGKFFPRGCRGFINTIDVYCDNPAGADRDVIIKVSVEPGMGELFTVNLTVAAGAAPGWRTVTVERFWNYDSLFVWITSEVQAFTTRMGYDTGAPPDGYDSADEITWTPQLRRYWIRINMVAETAGDVPVSGTINNIRIPSSTTIHETSMDDVPSGVATLMDTILGAGHLLEVRLEYVTTVVPAFAVWYTIIVYADGVNAAFTTNRWLTQSLVATSGRNSVGEFFQGTVVTHMSLRLNVEFRQKLEIYAYQNTGAAVTVVSRISVNLIR